MATCPECHVSRLMSRKRFEITFIRHFIAVWLNISDLINDDYFSLTQRNAILITLTSETAICWKVAEGLSNRSNSPGNNNPYPEPNQPNSLRSILILSSHLQLGLPTGLFPVVLPVQILKTLLPSCILTNLLDFLDLITLTILRDRCKLWNSSLWDPSPIPIFITLGPKYSLHDSVFNYP